MVLALYLGLVAFGCLILIFRRLRQARPSLRTHIRDSGTTGDTTTVIVGAGVVGLCTAYHLAKAINERTAKHRVIVIEAASKVFAATSSTNTGVLSYTGFKDELLPLAQYSYNQWETLGRVNLQFKTKCGYREGVNVVTKESNCGDDEGFIPNWIHAEPGWNAIKDPPHSKQAIINPVTLGVWLYEQCLHYGVEFRLNTKAVSADLSSTNEIVLIKVRDDGDGNGKFSAQKCNKLVLAAGPWTPGVLDDLFPKNSVKLEAAISAGEWFVFENSEPDSMIAATFFDDIVHQKLEFAGRNDHTIWATSDKTDIGTVPNLGQLPDPDPTRLAKLKTYSDRFLNNPDGGLRVVSRGQSYRPENRKQLPIYNCCVYINSGHGSYGVTLGMGTGKIMSQMILGDEPDVNVSKLGIPSDAFRISAYQEPGKVQQWDLFDRSFPMRQSGQPNEKL